MERNLHQIELLLLLFCMKKYIPIPTLILLAIAIAGMYKFNYLANQPGYNVDGNKSKQDVAQAEGTVSTELNRSDIALFVNKYIAQNEAGFEVSDGALPTTANIQEVDLDNDNKLDVVALIKGAYWCGTGGCTVVVFENQNGEYKEITSIPTSDSFFVQETRVNGWKEIKVISSGGGLKPTLEAYVYKDATYIETSSKEIEKIAQEFAEASEIYQQDGHSMVLSGSNIPSNCKSCYDYNFSFEHYGDPTTPYTVNVRVSEDGKTKYLENK